VPLAAMNRVGGDGHFKEARMGRDSTLMSHTRGFLPDIGLPSAETGVSFALRPASGATTVMVGVHSTACEGCRRYVDGLAASAPEFLAWDARLVIVVPGPGRFHARFGTVLADAGRRICSPEDAAVVVADRYGQIFDESHAGGGHGLPEPRQLEEWLKFLGTLCPE
jgi:hypothetical protein